MLASALIWPGGHAVLILGTAAASWRCLPLAVYPTYHLLREAGGLVQSGEVIGITSHGMASLVSRPMEWRLGVSVHRSQGDVAGSASSSLMGSAMAGLPGGSAVG